MTWISVKDRLPSDESIGGVWNYVLVFSSALNARAFAQWNETDKKWYIEYGWIYSDVGYIGEDIEHITHWMPLPEGPDGMD